MSRSSSLQFHLFTREEAAAFLARASYADTSYGDRVAAHRRLGYVTTAEERAAALADAVTHAWRSPWPRGSR